MSEPKWQLAPARTDAHPRCVDCQQTFPCTGVPRKRCPDCKRQFLNAQRRTQDRRVRGRGERTWDRGRDLPAARIEAIIAAELARIRYRRNHAA